MKKALLFGATGFIGSHLLRDLLSSPDYERVTVVVRRPLDIGHPKLNVLVGDYFTLPSLAFELAADDVFMALGTTTKRTPKREDYYRIDHDYPVLAAKLAKERGASSVSIVTAIGANASSNFFYVRTKGEIERDIRALGFERTHIFQPSMIVGERNEERAFEKTLIKFWNVVDRALIGKMDRYKGIDGKNIARAMVRAAANPSTAKVETYRWREMKALLT